MSRLALLVGTITLAGCPGPTPHFGLVNLGANHTASGTGLPNWEIAVTTPNLPSALHLSQSAGGPPDLYATLTPAGQAELAAALQEVDDGWNPPYSSDGFNTRGFALFDETEPGAHEEDVVVDGVTPELQRLASFGDAVLAQMNARTAGAYVSASATTP